MRGERYLTRPSQFAMVYGRGSSWASRVLVMKTVGNGRPLSRYGFSVSRKVGNAVVRNRVKRRLREILRTTPLKAGYDIIFIGRPPVAAAGYGDIKKAVDDLLSRARILESGGQAKAPAGADREPAN